MARRRKTRSGRGWTVCKSSTGRFWYGGRDSWRNHSHGGISDSLPPTGPNWEDGRLDARATFRPKASKDPHPWTLCRSKSCSFNARATFRPNGTDLFRGLHVGPCHRASMHKQHSTPRKPKTFSRGLYVGPSHRASMHEQHSAPRQPKMKLVEVLLYVHRNRRLIRDWSPGRPPRLSHSS